MWRICDEPIIALDGDTAGIRAAQRVMDLALPLLEAGKSLRFAVMPEGQDPDDLPARRWTERHASAFGCGAPDGGFVVGA